MYIDAHNHIHLPELSSFFDEALHTARSANVKLQLVNAVTPDDWQRLGKIASGNPDIIPFYGLHPWFQADAGWLLKLEELISANICGIGEIGLDRWKHGLDPEFQEKAFIDQLRLAKKYSRPVCIHCLKAWGKLVDILKTENPQSGILIHSFGGSYEIMRQLTELGAYFSFSGELALPGKEKKREMARQVPEERLLIETDAPDMLPSIDLVAHKIYNSKGKLVNSPANLPEIYRFIAKIRGIESTELTELSFKNAMKFLKELNIEGTVFKN